LTASAKGERALRWSTLYSIPAYSIFFSLTFSLEKITFGLLNIEFIKPRFALSPCAGKRGGSASGEGA